MPFFNKPTPYTQSDIRLNDVSIQVIASFSRTGEVLPLYAKLQSCTLRLFNVTKAEQAAFTANVFIRFRCKGIVAEANPEDSSEETLCKDLFLRYYIDEHIWVMEEEK